MRMTSNAMKKNPTPAIEGPPKTPKIGLESPEELELLPPPLVCDDGDRVFVP
jgi:hypothetical protein